MPLEVRAATGASSGAAAGASGEAAGAAGAAGAGVTGISARRSTSVMANSWIPEGSLFGTVILGKVITI